ncbi:MAG: hypothetical protein AB7H97_06375 [Pseudobdellovibrionaceae bacterium]
MSEHFNKLSPGEAERLAILAEECAEVIQVIGKILRHGYDSYNPFDDTKQTNRSLLEKECGDISAAQQMLANHDDIRLTAVAQWRERKLINVKKYTHHQDSLHRNGSRK